MRKFIDDEDHEHAKFTLPEIGNRAEIVHIFNDMAFVGSDEYYIIVLARIAPNEQEKEYEYTFFVNQTAIGDESKFAVQMWFYTDELIDKEKSQSRWQTHIRECEEDNGRTDRIFNAIDIIQKEHPEDWSSLLMYLECIADIEEQDLDKITVSDYSHLPVEQPTEDQLRRIREYADKGSNAEK